MRSTWCEEWNRREWREIDERYGFAILRGMLESSMVEGVIRAQPLDALAHVMLGALNEGALLIARSRDPGSTRTEVEASLLALMEGLRASPASSGPSDAVR